MKTRQWLHRLWTALLLLSVLPSTALADDHPTDTVPGINAIDHLMDRAWHPEGLPFTGHRALDHTYVQLGTCLMQTVTIANHAYNPMQSVSVGIGKQLGPFHALRLTGTLGTQHKVGSHAEQLNYSLQLDHLFNLSSYVAGYDPARVFELSTLAGAASDWQTAHDSYKHTYSIHAGLQNKLRLGRNAALLLEPQVALHFIDRQTAADNWRQLGISYGGNIGVAYAFNNQMPDKLKVFRTDSVGSPWFLEFTAGSELRMGIGRWFSHIAGWRMSGGASAVTDAGGDGDRRNLNGRFDILVNPLAHHPVDHVAGLQLAAGMELGERRSFLYPDQTERHNYLGYTLSAQAWLRLQHHLKWFVEPQWSLYSYYPHTSDYRYTRNSEQPFHLNTGLRIDYIPAQARQSKAGAAVAAADSATFTPDMFLQLGGGLGSLPRFGHTWTQPGPTDWNARLAWGWHLSKYSSLRVVADQNLWEDTDEQVTEDGAVVPVNRTLHALSLSADYMLHLLPALAGSSRNGPFDASAYTGPTLLFYDGVYGWHGGVQLSWRMNRRTSLFLSPELQYLSQPQQVGGTPLTRPVNMLFRTHAGLEYQFTSLSDFREGLFPTPRNERAGLNHPVFWNFGLGTAWITDEEARDSKTLGPTFQMGVARWMSPALAIRFDISGQWNDPNRRTRYALGGLHLMLNPFGLSPTYRMSAPVGLNVVAGAHLGNVHRGKTDAAVKGFSTGLQLWTRVQSTSRLYVEPRYMLLAYKRRGVNETDHSFGMHIGLQTDFVPTRLWRQAADGGEAPTGWFAQVEGGRLLLINAKKVQKDFEHATTHWAVGAGYQFSALSALRATVGTRLVDASIGTDYMLNIHRLLHADNAGTTFGLWMYAGPYFAFPAQRTSVRDYRRATEWGARAGFQFDARLTSHLGLYFAPELRAQSHRAKDAFARERNRHNYFQYNLGASYRFRPNTMFKTAFAQRMERLSEQLPPLFVTTSLGVGALNGTNVTHVADTYGPRYELGIGTWLQPIIGASLTMAANINKTEQEMGVLHYQGTGGMRIHLLLNPCYLFSNYREGKVGAYLSAGPEFGLYRRRGDDGLLTGSYAGYGCSLNAWVKTGQHSRIFLEPHIASLNHHDDNRNTTFTATDWQLGIALDAGMPPRTREAATSAVPTPLFVELSGGNNYILRGSNDTGHTALHPAWSIGAGYRLTPLIALRADYVSAPHCHEGALAVQYDLTEALQGPEPTRRLFVNAFAGLAHADMEREKNKLGIRLGVQFGYHLSRHCYLHLTPDAQWTVRQPRLRTLVGVGMRM